MNLIVNTAKRKIEDIWYEGSWLLLKMKKFSVETIFRETLNDTEYLYWYSVQGENGQNVEESEHWIDKKHLE